MPAGRTGRGRGPKDQVRLDDYVRAIKDGVRSFFKNAGVQGFLMLAVFVAALAVDGYFSFSVCRFFATLLLGTLHTVKGIFVLPAGVSIESPEASLESLLAILQTVAIWSLIMMAASILLLFTQVSTFASEDQ
jgi:hypothetical protein